jgi:hypothetical protein
VRFPPRRNYNRRALRRGVFLVWLLLVALAGFTSVAHAEPHVSLEPALDGTFVLVGRGWRPAARLVLSVGRDVFPAEADSAGEFEVQTGLPVTAGPFGPVSIRRQEPTSLAFARLAAPADPELPHPFAVLFARSLAMGAGWLALSAGGLGLAMLAARPLRSRRPRPD